MAARRTPLHVAFIATALVAGCTGAAATPVPRSSDAPTPSASSILPLPATASPTASLATIPSAGAGVPDPSGRVAFGRFTRYDDFFGPLALLYAIDPDGSDLLQLTTDDVASPRWSPDGSTIAVTIPGAGGSWQIATVPAKGGPLTVLTSGSGMSELPSWSPDGSWVAYDYSPTVGGPGFHNVLYRMDADGKNPRLLGNPDTWDVQPVISPDGRQVAFLRLNPDGEFGAIWIRDIATGKERELKAAGTDVETPAWSPDGQWIMYTRDLTILRVSSDGSGTPVVVVDHTANPRAYKATYAPDGRRIVLGCNGPDGDAICIANADGSGLALIGDLPGYIEHWADWGRAAP